MTTLSIDRSRLRRIVAAGDAAMGAASSASERVRDCRHALRQARDELSRWRGHEAEAGHARAAAAVEAAEIAVREAEAEHNRIAAEARPAGQVARLCTDYAASRGFPL